MQSVDALFPNYVSIRCKRNEQSTLTIGRDSVNAHFVTKYKVRRKYESRCFEIRVDRKTRTRFPFTSIASRDKRVQKEAKGVALGETERRFSVHLLRMQRVAIGKLAAL